MSARQNSSKEMVSMSTHEILRDKWVEFFQSFTSDHSGWLVTLGVKARRNNHKAPAIEGRQLPLRDIAADLKDKENTVVITIGGRGDDLLTHEVRTVSHVRLTQAENDPSAILNIEAANGQTTTFTVSAPTSSKN
jgi:hypothetical protein